MRRRVLCGCWARLAFLRAREKKGISSSSRQNRAGRKSNSSLPCPPSTAARRGDLSSPVRGALFATPDVTFRDGLAERSSNPVSTSSNSLWGLSDRLEKGRRPLSRSCCTRSFSLLPVRLAVPLSWCWSNQESKNM